MGRSGFRISTSAERVKSAARTAFGPSALRTRVAVCILGSRKRTTSSLRFKTISTTSSFTPGMVENSWRTSSM